MKTFPIEDVRTREKSQLTKDAAAARTAIVDQRFRPLKPMALALSNKAIDAKTTRAKVVILRRVVAIMDEITKGLVPCSKGCTACCHIPVLVCQDEADVIGREIGRKPAKVDYTRVADQEYIGTPCPFLKNDACSIYASRPLACRMHFNMDIDDMLCQIVPGASVKVPYLNSTEFLQTVVHILGPNKMLTQLADVRDYFPQAGRKRPPLHSTIIVDDPHNPAHQEGPKQ